VLLPVKVVPGASRTRFMGEWEGRAKIAVAAPAEGGKANKALIAFLAKRLGVRKNTIALKSGTTSPLKTIRIDRGQAEQVRAALGLDVG